MDGGGGLGVVVLSHERYRHHIQWSVSGVAKSAMRRRSPRREMQTVLKHIIKEAFEGQH